MTNTPHSASPLLWTILVLQLLIIAAIVYLFMGGTPRGGSLPAVLSTPSGAPSGPGTSGSAGSPPSSLTPASLPPDSASASSSAASSPVGSADPAADPFFAFPSAPSFFSPSPSPFFRPRPLSPFHGEFARAMAQAQALLDASAADLFSPDSAWSDLPATPTCNLTATPEAYTLSIALPALAPSDLSVRLDGRLLSVDASSDASSPNASSASSFRYRTLLPGPVPADAVPSVSSTADGVRIDVPRTAANPQPERSNP